MSVITISFGSSNIRGNIAEKVAEVMGYELVGREVLESASKKFDIPETKLSHVIHSGPSFFGMSDTTRKQYIAYILASAAEFLQRDNIVYHGPAGHILSQSVSHIMKVFILISSEVRISYLMEHDNLSREKAGQVVAREEKTRKKWAGMVFGMDDSDPKLFDLAIDIGEISMEEAVERITAIARGKKYQPMTYSWQCVKNVELSCRITTLLIDIDPDVRVRCEEGNALVKVKVPKRAMQKNKEIIKQRVEELPGVEQVEIQMRENLFDRIACSMR